MQTHAAARLHRVAIAPKGQNYEDYYFYSLFFHLLFFLPTYLPQDTIVQQQRERRYAEQPQTIYAQLSRSDHRKPKY